MDEGMTVPIPVFDPDPADGSDQRSASPDGSIPPASKAGPWYVDDEHLGLRLRVREHLEGQGFKITPAGVIAPVETDKTKLRDLHVEAVEALRERGRAALTKAEPGLINRLARGRDLTPAHIRPRLVPIDTYRSPGAELWRWCSLHWSIPVSGGYGRRLRFLVVDEAHEDAVMGLIGLADPVFALAARDREIGWNPRQRAERLTSVMDAFVLGAVPPYADLLGGKLIAMLVASREVGEFFAEKYSHRRTLIADRDPNARLALITTSSALGRSSVYNRVRRPDGSPLMRSVGYTQGTGDFHFSGAIYDELAEFATEHAGDAGTHRHERWGASGFRNRREVIQKALRELGLSAKALRLHGVRREVYLTELASNTAEYLCGHTDDLEPYDLGANELAEHWKSRWAVPRSARSDSWRHFDPRSWALYS